MAQPIAQLDYAPTVPRRRWRLLMTQCVIAVACVVATISLWRSVKPQLLRHIGILTAQRRLAAVALPIFDSSLDTDPQLFSIPARTMPTTLPVNWTARQRAGLNLAWVQGFPVPTSTIVYAGLMRTPAGSRRWVCLWAELKFANPSGSGVAINVFTFSDATAFRPSRMIYWDVLRFPFDKTISFGPAKPVDNDPSELSLVAKIDGRLTTFRISLTDAGMTMSSDE